MSVARQGFLAVIRRFFESKFRKKSIVLRYDKKDKSKDLSFFIQSEGLVCNRRQAYVITRSVYGITAGVFTFGLITYIT